MVDITLSSLKFLIPNTPFLITVLIFLLQWGVNSYFFHKQTLRTTLVNILSFYIGLVIIKRYLLDNFHLPSAVVIYDLNDFWNKNPILTIIVVIILQEFLLYLGHWACHKHPLLWAIHEPHHSVTELNMSASFRTGWLMPFVYMFASYPMIFLLTSLNIDWKFLLIPEHAIILIYQIILHSGITYKNKYLSRIFILPGDHAKHHELAPIAQNSNYGSCLSIYDHIFGTYNGTPNTEIYGCMAQRNDLNIFKIQLSPFARAFELLKTRPTLKAKLRLFVLGKI